MERVSEDLSPVVFDFTGNDRNGFLHQRLDIRFLITQHIDRPTGVEAADNDIDSRGAKFSRQFEGPGKLVGLDSHQTHDELGRRAPAPANDFSYRKFLRGLVEGNDLDGEIAEYATSFHLLGQAMQDVERVAREDALPKTNHITVVVVLGGFD